MIGVLGRVAGSQIVRQGAIDFLENLAGGSFRQVATQELQRLLANPRIQDQLTSQQLRILAKKLGQAGLASYLSSLIMRGSEEEEEEEEPENPNDRMVDFGNKIRGHLNHNRTLYAEERDVFNKEMIDDKQGLSNAYASPSGLYKVGNTLYISGTGGRDGSITRDIMDDLIRLPSRNARNTEKYKDVMKELKGSPEVNRLVGHSLASAVINTINEDQPNRFATTTYATPTIKPKRKGEQNPRRKDFRNLNDPVSKLDGYAITSDFQDKDPFTAHSFRNFDGVGHFDMHPSTAISNGIRVNDI